ncbi:hypothetical protein B9Q13_03195 [Candidatus Marsarchaeota G2 archaeon ECH_B_SAG-G16]|uniref:ABC transporter substrate-binding protein n=1 Tax=Candidatus Marsarchaeota G2 archaeon ECH_B_SAG-G16 TaxID=1978167 RepID=A0A2R6C264_9ARCH|nr:MAG: hypothetical protein B9Q13_03195 [Candidatus Marsarchaeota G2 archaeon ECH_B_SAG-G16]
MPTNPSSSAQAPVTIVFTGWVSSGAEYQFDQEMVNAFNAQHTDVQVVFQPITSDYDTKLKTEIAAGNAPDVFYVDSSQVFSYVQNGLLLPLNQFVNSDSSYNISDFIPETLNAFKFNNNIYAIPKDWSPLALFYNVKMFEQAGISSPPSTWQQLYQDAAKLTVKSNGKVVTYGLALPPDMARILAFVYQGGWTVDNTKRKKRCHKLFSVYYSTQLHLPADSARVCYDAERGRCGMGRSGVWRRACGDDDRRKLDDSLYESNLSQRNVFGRALTRRTCGKSDATFHSGSCNPVQRQASAASMGVH